MNFQNHPPVRLFLGDNAMRDNIDRFRIGKKALVVSGKHGADACGAMAEVDEILAAVKESVAYLRGMSPVWRDMVAGKKPFLLK